MTGDIRDLATGSSCHRCDSPAAHCTDTGELLCPTHALLGTLAGENIVTVDGWDAAEMDAYAPLSTLDQMCPEMYPEGESTTHRTETKDPHMAPKLPTPEECRSIYAEAVGMFVMRTPPQMFDHGDAERVGFHAVLALVEARLSHSSVKAPHVIWNEGYMAGADDTRGRGPTENPYEGLQVPRHP